MPSLAARFCAVTLRALLALACCASLAFGAQPEPDRSIKQQDDPLVRQLEALYVKSMEVASTGDIDAYWRFRTAAARNRPPVLDSVRLKMLAEMLPPLDMQDFVRLDAAGPVARALYRWRLEDVSQFTVLVFRKERGDWKLDELTVKSDAALRGRKKLGP